MNEQAPADRPTHGNPCNTGVRSPTVTRTRNPLINSRLKAVPARPASYREPPSYAACSSLASRLVMADTGPHRLVRARSCAHLEDHHCGSGKIIPGRARLPGGAPRGRRGGVPYRPERRSDMCRQHCAAAVVPAVTLHAARHRSVTAMRDAGVPDHVGAAFHGHDKVVMRRTYSRAQPDGWRRRTRCPTCSTAAGDAPAGGSSAPDRCAQTMAAPGPRGAMRRLQAPCLLLPHRDSNTEPSD
jgi:hypothetical protein